MGLLPEAWIAPPEIRELRELARHKLVKARTSYKDQVHGVLAKLGIPVTHSDIFGVHGQDWLDELPCRSRTQARSPRCGSSPAPSRPRSPCWTRCSPTCWTAMRGYRAIQQLPGIGPVLAAVIVAEIGDIRRFPGPGQLGVQPR